MELIHISIPIFFFLLSMIETHLTPKKNKLGKNTDGPRKCLLKIQPKIRKAKRKDGLNSLDYITDAPLELNRLRIRTKYRYKINL
jgi:hypothetical protein